MEQSNKRYFNTYFFADPYIEDLSSNETLVYLSMLLNPRTNVAGLYEISTKKIMDFTKLDKTVVMAAIQKLSEDKKILFSDNWLAIKNFYKNNKLNPNMCYKAFEIMKKAPKDKVIFILADKDGTPEEWVFDFVKKVESGINARIDSKNREAKKRAIKEGKATPVLINHINYGIEDLQRDLLDKPKNKSLLEPLPQPLGESFPHRLPQQRPEYEVEREIEKEYEVEREIEKEEDLLSTYEELTSNNYNSKDLMRFIKYANSKTWITSYRFPLAQCADAGALLNACSVYSQAEILESIDNYDQLMEQGYDVPVYGNSVTFLIKGIEKYLTSSKPFEKYRKKNQGDKPKKEKIDWTQYDD